MLRQQIPAPGKIQRGGLVSGEQDRDDLVAKLLVAHGIAVVVARAQEQREQILRCTSWRAAALRAHSLRARSLRVGTLRGGLGLLELLSAAGYQLVHDFV